MTDFQLEFGAVGYGYSDYIFGDLLSEPFESILITPIPEPEPWVETFPIPEPEPWIETFPNSEPEPWIETFPIPEPEPWIETFPCGEDHGVTILNSKTEIPSKLKQGEKVKTPNTHPNEFTKKGSKYIHNKTKWEFQKDKSGHRGEHWDVSPKNGKTGDYYNISPDGRIL